VGKRRAGLSFFLGAILHFPAGPLGSYDRDCLRFFLPTLIKTAQQEENHGSHKYGDANPEEQTNNESQYSIHRLPQELRIFS
jgi:hypothetical protein